MHPTASGKGIEQQVNQKGEETKKGGLPQIDDSIIKKPDRKEDESGDDDEDDEEEEEEAESI